MSNLPGVIAKVTVEETDFDSNLTESLMQKLGKNINGLIDLINNVELFTTSTTFVVPDNINQLFMVGCGGGGGGGGATTPYAGGGGAGSPPVLMVRGVVPGETLTINIGAGGAAGLGQNITPGGTSGGDGGNTTITGSVSGELALWRGAPGGKSGTVSSEGGVGDFTLFEAKLLAGMIIVNGGNGGRPGGGTTGGYSIYINSVTSQPGTRGISPPTGGGGGGGGAGLTRGGNGGNGGTSAGGGVPISSGDPGTGYGAGGGGGGGGGGSNGGHSGGDGFQGFVAFYL